MNPELVTAKRRVLLLGLVLLATMIAALLLVGILTTFSSAQVPLPKPRPAEFAECVADEADIDRIRAVMYDALDEALKAHIVHLFDVWMRDYKLRPENTLAGARNAINARISARKRAAEWYPPICKEAPP